MKTSSFRWIVDRNPFYLLSACSGLTGCWLLGDVSRPDLADAAMKIGAVLAYEIAVVALAVWLAGRAGTHRDAAILSVLTLALTADVAFFYTEAAMLNPRPATLFSIFGAAQALVVAGTLLRGVRVQLSKTAEWLIALDLAALHLMPLALRLSAQDRDGLELAFWAAFSAVGMILASHALPPRWCATQNLPGRDLPRTLALIAPVVIVVSLWLHVVAAEWIYEVRFFAVFLSPVFLGYAAIGLRCEFRQDRQAIFFTPGRWACALSVFAAIFALGAAPDGTIWNASGWSWFGLSPLRLVLAGTAAICWGQWRMRRGFVALTLASGASVLAALGHTPEAMEQHARGLWRAARHAISLTVPHSRAGWGVILFCFAFLLLGLGAAISWRHVRLSGSSPVASED